MRRLGLLGGMSWESSAIYYRHLNTMVRERLGGLNSADLVLHSLNFAPIAQAQREDDWSRAARLLCDSANALVAAGAEGLLICSNTMHKLADTIGSAVSVPLIHIGDAVADRLKAAGCRRPLLLGTRFTMESRFYVERLRDRHGIEAIVPGASGRSLVHCIIYEELCQGRVLESSRVTMVRMIEAFGEGQADAVLLGCTELTMLLGPSDLSLPVFDTTRIHAEAGLEFALGGPPPAREGSSS